MGELFNQKIHNDIRRKLRNETPRAERLLWQKLKGGQLMGYKFRRQYGVGPFVVDFYCPAIKLAIEVDGDSHFLPGVTEQDKAREAYLKSKGISILRFLNTDVYRNLSGVLETIRLTLVKDHPLTPPC